VEAKSTRGQGSRRAVAPSGGGDDDSAAAAAAAADDDVQILKVGIAQSV
jgi:hypothetical protein